MAQSSPSFPGVGDGGTRCLQILLFQAFSSWGSSTGQGVPSIKVELACDALENGVRELLSPGRPG